MTCTLPSLSNIFYNMRMDMDNDEDEDVVDDSLNSFSEVVAMMTHLIPSLK